MEEKKVILKIAGIIAGIALGCVVLAFIVGAPIMRNLQYNNAIENAKNGYYEVAIQELEGRNMDDYKDVKYKKQQYCIEAAKQYIEKGDIEKAKAYLEKAKEINASEYKTKEAKELMREIIE